MVLPGVVLVLGLMIGSAADIAVGRFEAYALYGLARPVADLLILIGGAWLVFALVIAFRVRRH